MVQLVVMVSGRKTPSCWHKVVIVKKHNFCIRETSYEVAKKLHSCRLISHNAKH